MRIESQERLVSRGGKRPHRGKENLVSIDRALVGQFLSLLMKDSDTRVTSRMVDGFIDSLRATRISYYRDCPTCKIGVDTFCESTKVNAPHFCNICGTEIDVWE